MAGGDGVRWILVIIAFQRIIDFCLACARMDTTHCSRSGAEMLLFDVLY